MDININGMNVHYEVSGSGKDAIILHGWGTNLEVMRPAAKCFDEKMKVYNIDLPGFGGSDEPCADDWDIYSYADFIAEFVKKLGIERPVILAHSFGGRIALILAGKKLIRVNKLILTGCAGIKPKRGIDYYAKVYTYKLSKKAAGFLKLFSKDFEEKMKKKYGSADYASASDKMRAVMVRAVNEDLTYLLPEIDVPTLLVWGENDDATPLSDGKTMERLIPDAGLIVMPESGHYAFLQNIGWFSNIVRNFCGKDMEEV
ncbi:MAG: alpha/beta hydrolase [Ruminococcaceae bacterium]|nr:alpha/beta hydrolase [Oscillospiraceae bacterium]